VGSGISQIFVSVNYMADAIADHFGDGEQFGCEIEYLREETENPLGTAGALRLLPAEVRDGTDAVVVMNGDLVTQFDVTALLSAHTLGGFAATVGARDHSHSIPFGVLDTRAGDVIGIEEKPTASWLVNAGIYAVDPSLIADVPADVEYPITELLAHAMRTERRVGAHRIDGDWIDVGRHDELRRARGMEA
jgi:NDP-sugar pyrophosphorylase family protein